MSEVSRILSKIESGDPASAMEQLLPLVYDELRILAAAKLAHEQTGLTLQATALVHEAWLRLVGTDGQELFWNSRRHFFGAAAEAMRRILIDNARRKNRLKRGGDRQREEVDVAEIAAPESREDLLALDVALDRLAAAEPEAAQLVQLRYFAGLTQAEAAHVLQLSLSSADRLCVFACGPCFFRNCTARTSETRILKS